MYLDKWQQGEGGEANAPLCHTLNEALTRYSKQLGHSECRALHISIEVGGKE